MKKILLSGLLVALTASTFAQGQVTLRNISNTDTSPTATANGLFFLDICGDGIGPRLISQDFNAVFYGGSDSANLVLLGSFVGAGAVGDNAAGPGTFSSATVATIPGATSSAFLKIEAWLGSPFFVTAFYRNNPVIFSNPLGNPTPKDLDGMPAIIISNIICPEPSSLALVGLGAAALLFFRRRK